MVKRIGEAANNEVPKAEVPHTEEINEFNYDKEQSKVQEAIGGTEPDDDVTPTFLVDEEQIDRGMTLNKQEEVEGAGLTPLNRVDTQVRQQRSGINYEVVETKRAQPATPVDLSNLDESMILDMPQIKAATFEVIDMMSLKPKDPAIRFRWANYKNFTSGNLGRYYALGFKNASPDDIDMEKTPVDPSMIEGTQIKWYDVILIKINVIRLMELYKSNIIKSVNRLVKHRERGVKEA